MLLSFLTLLTRHGEQVTPTGSWKIPADFHYHLDSNFATAIARLVRSECTLPHRNCTVLDVGAGKGLYVRYWRGHGLEARGIEGVGNIETVTNGFIRQADLALLLPRTSVVQADGTVVERCERYESEWVTCLEGVPR